MKIRTFLSIAILTVLASCSPKTNKEKKESAVRVNTYYPTRTSSEEIFISGIVSAKQTALISTKVMGYIDKIYVKQGDFVKRGQPLVIINSSDLKAKEAQSRAMIAEAEAAAKDAQRDYQRYQALHNEKSVSDKELENIALKNTSARAHLQMARQGLKEVRSMLAYTNIRAPFSGVVTQKMTDEGNMASPGTPLLSIEESGDLNITASVPESYITNVHTGEQVKIDIKSLHATINGMIKELSPSAAMTGGQYGVKIAISQKDKARLHPGMYAGIHIPNKAVQEGAPQILVKKSSVVSKDQLTGIYVADKDSKAVLHWVRLGKETGNQVVVLSGISMTDCIIEHTDAKLHNGQKIIVTN